MTPSTSQAEWREVVSRFVKSEMSKRKMKYQDLTQLLEKTGTVQRQILETGMTESETE